MFQLCTRPTFTHPVEVTVPVDGGHERQTFRATFEVMTTDDVAAYDLQDGASSAEFLRKVFVGFDDVTNENGNPATWSDLRRDQLLSVPYVRAALARTYFAAVGGAALGN